MVVKRLRVGTVIVDKEFRKRIGYFDTPQNIVNFMINLIPREKIVSARRILEPGCGLAPFSRALAGIRGSWDGLECIDINEEIVRELKRRYPGYTVRHGDYLLVEIKEKYDIIIGNPPYGIIGDESHYAISTLKDRRELYKRLYETWRGKYNIYGAFIEKSVKILSEGGILVFIVPATWMILDEFAKLRRFLAERGRIKVYYVGRVFSDLNVVCVVLYFVKGGRGLELYDAENLKSPVLNKTVEDYSGEMITFETSLTREIEESAVARLGELFDIKISPRSPEIKKSQLVSTKKLTEEHIPILNGKNLNPNWIDYNTCYSGYYIKRGDVGRLREWFLRDRIVVGHTKGGKLVAAIDYRHYPWMGDVYHLIPRSLETSQHRFTLEEVNQILNSHIMNRYMREKYREITPHVMKSQLEILPLVPLEKLKKLEALKRQGTSTY